MADTKVAALIPARATMSGTLIKKKKKKKMWPTAKVILIASCLTTGGRCCLLVGTSAGVLVEHLHGSLQVACVPHTMAARFPALTSLKGTAVLKFGLWSHRS